VDYEELFLPMYSPKMQLILQRKRGEGCRVLY